MALNRLKAIFEEVVILSTCNRTEIYFWADLSEEVALELVFKSMEWDIKLMKYFCG